MKPMAPATLAAGSSSLMMPKASGNSAPPTPCTARPATSSASVVARPDKTVPATRAAMVASSIRRLPNMSPSRPMIGVATEADSK